MSGALYLLPPPHHFVFKDKMMCVIEVEVWYLKTGKIKWRYRIMFCERILMRLPGSCDRQTRCFLKYGRAVLSRVLFSSFYFFLFFWSCFQLFTKPVFSSRAVMGPCNAEITSWFVLPLRDDRNLCFLLLVFEVSTILDYLQQIKIRKIYCSEFFFL
jgi:hypothetical protein